MNAKDEELSVISCIYPDDWVPVKPGAEFQMRFNFDGNILKVALVLPPNYPAEAPQWKLVSRTFSLSEEQQAHVHSELQKLYEMDPGPVIFKWIDWFRDNLPILIPQLTVPAKPHAETPAPAQSLVPKRPSREYNIVHGEPITDRKSKFIASMVRVNSASEVSEVFEQMKADRKFGSATHIITAVRLRTSDNKLNELRNDDGETGAGDKLLFLLTQLRIENVMVMVSRWFGGTQLGPDRFKHIVNQAREILDNVDKL